MGKKVSRGAFLRLVWQGLLGLSGALGLGGLLRFLSYQPADAHPTTFDLGPADDFLTNDRTPMPEARAVIIRQGEALAALSAICPHLGCQVNLTAEGFICPCHGSRFDEQGHFLSGRAGTDLQPLILEETPAGELILHTQ